MKMRFFPKNSCYVSTFFQSAIYFQKILVVVVVVVPGLPTI
jgi:hypothetical protein